MDDLRYGVRSLSRRPAFTAFAAFTVALGVGATTAIFSTVEAVLINPLPYEHGDRMAGLFRRLSANAGAYVPPSPEQRAAWSGQTDLFEALEPWSGRPMTLTGAGEPRVLLSALVRPAFLELLGRSPVMGRVFSEQELAGDGARVVVVSHDFWQSALGGGPDALGRSVQLDGVPWTVIGVLPPATPLPGWGLTSVPIWRPFGSAREGDAVQVTALLAEGATLAHVNERLREMGDAAGGTNDWFGEASLVTDQISRGVVGSLGLLMGAVVLLLAIACVNVSNLLLFRAETRKRETAVRAALGGGARRLGRQLLVESLLLAGLGGGLGLLLAVGARQLILAMRPGQLEVLDSAGLNGTVLAFALGVTLLTGLVFGLLPAVHTVRREALDTLRSGARTAGDVVGGRARWLLVVSEVALSFAPLLGSVAVVTTLLEKQSGDVGFDADRVIALEVEAPGWRYPTGVERAPVYERILERLAGIPGVERVARASGLPPRAGITFGTLEIEGRDPTEDVVVLHGPTVGEGYFETLGQPIVAGRGFDARDLQNEARVMVVGEGTAEAFFPDGDAIGSRLRVSQDAEWTTIVGVAGDVAMTGLNPNRVPLQAYTPLSGRREEGAFTIRVSPGVDAQALIPTVRAEVRAIDEDLRVDGLATAEAHMITSLENERFLTTLMTTFAALALLLAAVGLYGVVSQVVGQRTREIGIRIALGARRIEVSGMVLRSAVSATTAGVLIGAVLTGGVVRALDGTVFGVEANTPSTYVIAAVGLMATALLAAWAPSRRAAGVDPVRAMRVE
jgi:predicted permease